MKETLIPHPDPRQAGLCAAIGSRPCARGHLMTQARARKALALYAAGFFAVRGSTGWRFVAPGGSCLLRLNEACRLVAYSRLTGLDTVTCDGKAEL